MKNIKTISQILQAKMKDKKGQSMVEYALVLVLVALVVAGFIPGVTTAISTAYTDIATQLAAR